VRARYPSCSFSVLLRRTLLNQTAVEAPVFELLLVTVPEATIAPGIGLYKICVYFKACVHERIILFFPSPSALPTLLHDYCTTIAQYTPPPLTPLLYAIHRTKLVLAIFCKGQSRKYSQCARATPLALSLCSPPLECIFWITRLFFTCIPPVSHRILGIPLYPSIYLHLAILQQIHCIQLYPYVSSCIQLYLTIPHRLENGIWPKIHSRGGLR